MNLKYLFTLLFFGSFFEISTMEIDVIIEKDDVEALDVALNAGLLNIDSILRTTKGSLTLLSCAIINNAEKIALHLIERGANIHAMSDTKKCKVNPLLLALISNCSISLCQILIDRKINIHAVAIRRKTLFKKEKILSIFHCCDSRNFSYEKKQFIVQYLLNIYGEQVLEIALSKESDLRTIVTLVENGAYIPPNIIEIAKQFKADKKIIDFFIYQFELRKKLFDLTNIPASLIDLICHYSYAVKSGEKLLANKELAKQLSISIISNEIPYLLDYLRKGGDPNFIIENDEGKFPLLIFALKNGKEEIANLLIQYKADINLKSYGYDSSDGLLDISPLWASIMTDEISLDFVKKLLKEGANINKIARTSYNSNLTTILILKWDQKATNEKIRFIIEYLLNLYGSKILEYIFADERVILNLDIIKFFVEKGVRVDKKVIDQAIKNKVSTDIVDYLVRINELDEQFNISNLSLPSNILSNIDEYLYEKENVAKEENKKCVIS